MRQPLRRLCTPLSTYECSDYMRAISDNEEEKIRYFYAWKCEKIRDTDRPYGQPVKDGCGSWNVKASKYEMGNKHLQGNCPICKRRARLNMNTRKIYCYTSREAAETHCRAMNEHGVSLAPTDIVEDTQVPWGPAALLAEISEDVFYDSLGDDE